jgi:carbamoyltransferase
MQYTTQVLNSKIASNDSLKFYERLTQIDSPIPAVTHLDLSARVQTVNSKQNSKLYRLISSYYKFSNIPVLINTSFNVRGEPIVCTPQDALDCFLSTEIDILVINEFIIKKTDLGNDFIIQKRVFTPD